MTALALTALALTALALTACTGKGGEGQADAVASATPVTASASASGQAAVPTPPTATTAPAAPGEGTAPAGTTRWAGTKQFMQIREGWISGGRTYLSVRTARKVAATGPHEAWLIIPGEGPYTTVLMATDARVLLSVPLGDNSAPSPYSQAEFVNRLMSEPSSSRSGLGYDLSFDGKGRVTRLQSLYTS
ncbi:hypothetical protein C7M71_026040 [Peterkaempfera bronchialis]|uniref:Lipoprotein n=1 Tax=Peterkaempfera bronchialis TaxID=2126346 RepID=A0A345T6R8_9ACTN|nr:hypothetical protein C7M71_026040 [Peterkaempfera bronchialis]